VNLPLTRLLPAALALLISACGGGGPTPAPGSTPTPGSGSATTGPTNPLPATIDACTLLSDAEVEAATGYGVTSQQLSNLRPDVFPSICDIELDSGGALTVSIRASGGKELYETSFEPFIGEENGPLDVAITGLGDKAGQQGDDNIMVLTGDVLFDVFYIEFGRNDKATVVRYLAEIVLAKLPCIATGCPGFTPPPPPSAATSVDACTLLTQDEIESATGFEVLEIQPEDTPGQDPSCTWTLNTQPFPGADYIELAVKPTGGQEQFDFFAGAYEPPLEHVTGIGDDAIKTATIPGGAMYALVGDQLVTLQFAVPLDVDDPYALVTPLLELAVPRL
jgi:hypothetical protein